MDAIEKLLAIEEIKQTKARYFRFMDTKDRNGLASVFSRTQCSIIVRPRWMRSWSDATR